MTSKREAAINLRVPTDWFRKIDTAVAHRPIRTSRHSWIMEAIHHQLQHENVEGTLDIFWENSEDRAVKPSYRLIFCKYTGFAGGAMQPNYILGDAALKRYLAGLGIEQEEVKVWVKRVKAERSVPIPRVMMPLNYLADYGYGPPK